MPWRRLYPVAIIGLLAACGLSSDAGDRRLSGSLEEIPIDTLFRASATFLFEDPPSNPLGLPFMGFVDARNRLIVGDLRMADVKMYAAEGDLLGIIGRSGRGPGEYIRPLSVTEDLLTGDILVSDVGNPRVLRYSSPPDSGTTTLSLQVSTSLQHVIALPGDRLLVAGTPDNAMTGRPMAGVIVTRDGEAEAQLIPLPARLVGRALSGNALSGVIALSGNRILGLLDGGNVIYKYDFKGVLLDSLVIPTSLREPVVLPEFGQLEGGMTEHAALLGSMQWITSIFPIGSDRFVLQFQDSVTRNSGLSIILWW